MEKAIVTVKDRSGQFERDMELPVGLPVSVLAKKLLEALKIIDQRTFSPYGSLSLFCGGKALDKTKTLNELEIWDGSIIVVQQEAGI